MKPLGEPIGWSHTCHSLCALSDDIGNLHPQQLQGIKITIKATLDLVFGQPTRYPSKETCNNRIIGDTYYSVHSQEALLQQQHQ